MLEFLKNLTPSLRAHAATLVEQSIFATRVGTLHADAGSAGQNPSRNPPGAAPEPGRAPAGTPNARS